MERKFSLSLVVAVFNEEQLLEEFTLKALRDLAAVANDFEIVFVDDGSTDRSRAMEDELARKYPQIKLVKLAKNGGLGNAYAAGFKAATKEVVFNNTVDSFFDTAELPQLLPYLEKADVLSCYRTNTKSNNPYQKILTLGNYWLLRILFPVKLKAYQTLQFYRRDFYQAIDIESRSTFIAPEQLMKAIAMGKSVAEVPIVYHPRKKGEAKGGKPKFVLQTFRDILKFWFRWVVLRRPMVIAGGQKYPIRSYYSEKLKRGTESSV